MKIASMVHEKSMVFSKKNAKKLNKHVRLLGSSGQSLHRHATKKKLIMNEIWHNEGQIILKSHQNSYANEIPAAILF